MASLTISNDAGQEKFALEAGAVTLGRGLESDIRLKDIKSSRRHCQVVKAAEGYKLVDLGSGNGTYVNGILVDREHKLRNGDTIQIGGTTITFVDAPPAGKLPTASKPPTEADRKAAKDATSRVPAVTATSRTTAKTPATTATKKTTTASIPGKKSTASIPVAGTGRVTAPVKPSTSKIQTAAGGSTTRRGSTGKVPTAAIGKTTKRVTATERMTANVGKKKTNPMIFLIGGAVVALLAIVAIIMLAGGPDELEYDRSQIKEKTAAAAKAVDANDFDKGIALYEEALKIAQKHEKLGPQVESIKKNIEDTKTAKTEREQAQVEWSDLVKEFNAGKYTDGGKETVKAMKDKVTGLQNKYKDFGFSWITMDPKDKSATETNCIAKMVERLTQQYNTELEIEKGSGFQVTRARISKEFLAEKKDFAGALAEWQKYIETVKSEDAKRMARNEVVKVNSLANEDWDRLKKKADAFVAGGNKEDALKVLEEALPRFPGCKFNEVDLEAAMKAKIEELKK